MGLFDDIVGIAYKDYLAPLTVYQVAAFYRRLAQMIESIVGKGNSLASILLLHWLEGKGADKEFDSAFVKGMPEIDEFLLKNVRPVFLTEEKAQLHSGSKWAGIVPRLKRTGDFASSDPRDANGNYPMMYEPHTVFEPVTTIQFASVMKKYQKTKALSEKEKHDLDIYTSLHAFALQSKVVASASPATIGISANSRNSMEIRNYTVSFKAWKVHVEDKYDWNTGLGFPVPNPDFKSTLPDAVAPDKEVITVYHKNAGRIENAGLANQYKVRSSEWDVVNSAILAPKTIDVYRANG